MAGRKDSKVFLKAIQIQGFKSFADRLRLDLQPGLSVIVGPNGSGKSNVADAVRWVLGEQSAKSLRGSKMEDVIFSGSSARKPVGMAEVSLVFDNSTGLFALDYEEVVITRRVYRDGEGHYFINRTPCRLKDIQELFLDTGSGKEGFSIIGQGRVEEVLNQKSDERRLLIEEVAGISKFRLRKKEALKKLEETEQNVSRLHDIISEVEARLEPLAKQAETAKISKDWNAELESSEIKLIVNELSETNAKLTKSQESMDEINNQLTIMTTTLAQEENTSIRSKYELNQLEQRLQDLQAEVYALENQVKEAEHELSLITERQGYTREQLSRLEREIVSENQKISLTTEKLDKLQEKEVSLQDNLQKASQSLHERESRLAELRDLSGAQRLEDLKTEIFEELSQKSKISNQLAEIENQRSSLRKQEEELIQDLADHEAEKGLLGKEISKLDEDKLTIELHEDGHRQRLEEINREVMRLREEQHNLEERAASLTRNIDRAGARRNALQTLEDNLEGYQKGVREILFAYRHGDINCGPIYGTVAENIEVDSKYELAMETSLGGALQNIIVKTTDDGKKCIAYLKKTNNGRATFLPLDSIRGSRTSLDGPTLKHQGFLGLAVDLVKYDQRFKDVMESLLGRILVADNMDSAIEIARINQYRVRVVTLQGDQVNLGGSLTGGSTRSQNSGLLSRAREIEELTQEISELSTRAEAEQGKLLLKKAEIEEYYRSKEDLEAQLKKLSEAKGIMAVDRKHKEENKSRLEESLRLLNLELTDIRSQFALLKDKEAEMGRLLESSGLKIAEFQTEQADLEQLVKSRTAEAESLAEEITAAKIESARREQELNQTKLLLTEEQDHVTASKQIIEEKQAEMNGIRESQAELFNGQKEAQEKIQDAGESLNAKKFRLVELRQQRENLSAKAIRQEEDVQAKQRQAKDLEQQLHQNELRVTRLEAEWEAGCSRLLEEYNLTWEEAFVHLTQEKKELLQEKILTLKARIEELGPVNYTALDEYPEALKRFEFLTTQKDDLMRAGDSLNQLIGELDKKMIERFEEGFKAVNEAFQEVFKELFHGGYAELQLDDPDNLLETGVKIVAQPPGKKAQLLSLLSGGERAFTAIALLFAFLKVKPSPFCLLDEIEAALDEANVKRFVQYLHTLTEQTQFILISHRRGTMESADHLYGITMEESGVSKLLTVELEDRAG